MIGTRKGVGQKFRKQLIFLNDDMTVPNVVQVINLYLGNISPERKLAFLNLKEEIVLGCISNNLTNKEICRDYMWSISLVKYTLSRVYSKLSVSNRVEAALRKDKIIV